MKRLHVGFVKTDSVNRRRTVTGLFVFLLAVATLGTVAISPLLSAQAQDPTDTTLSDDFLKSADGSALEKQSSQEALWTGQKVTPSADKRSATVTQSMYTTGNVGNGAAKPTDLVFVLDVSYSMNASLSSMMNGVKALIKSTQEQSDPAVCQANLGANCKLTAPVNNRISVVLFSGAGRDAANSVVAPTMTYPFNTYPGLATPQSVSDDTSGAFISMTDSTATSTLISDLGKVAVNNASGKTNVLQAIKNGANQGKFTANGSATQTGDGMKQAYDVLNGQGDSDHAKQVILFTDGVPGNNDWTKRNTGNNNTDAAYQSSEAIKYANQMANSLGATVYSAGYFSDSTGTMGSDWWDSESDWETTDFTNFTAGAYDPALTKRFLEMVSSNISFSDSVLADGYATPLMNTKEGTDWTLKVNDADSDYIRFATQASELEDMFSNMIPKVDKAGVALDSNAVINNLVATGFNVPRDSSGAIDTAAIKVYEEAATDPGDSAGGTSPTFDNSFVELAPNAASSDTVTVSASDDAAHPGYRVTGWDFAGNYIGTHTSGSEATGSAAGGTGSSTSGGSGDAFYGRRLVIQYTVSADTNTDGDDLTLNDVSGGAGSSGIVEGDITAAFGTMTMDVPPLADNSWIPGCTVDASAGVCLGKRVDKVSGSDTDFTVTLSVYALGSLNSAGKDTVTNSAITDATNIVDFPSGYFSVAKNASDVRMWEQKATLYNASTGAVKFADPLDQSAPNLSNGTDGISVTFPGAAKSGYAGSNKIYGPEVSGWGLATNYVGEHSDSASAGNYGKRIIIQFTEKMNSTFLGGKKVPMNWVDMSGLTDDAPGSSATYLAKFPSVTKDFPLSSEAIKLRSGKAYYGGTYDLENVVRVQDGSELKFDQHPDGTRDNDYVDIKFTMMKMPIADPENGFPGGSQTTVVMSVWRLEHGTTEGVETPISTDGKEMTVGMNDITLTAAGMAEFADGSSTSPSMLGPATTTIYTMTPQVKVKDSSISLGSTTKVSDNIDGWTWHNATLSDDQLSALPLASDKVTGASGKDSSPLDVEVTCVRSGCQSGAVADNDASLTPETTANLTVTGLKLKNASGTSIEATLDGDMALSVVADHSTVSDDDKSSALVASDADSSFDPTADANFSIYVLAQRVSSLPLTGGMGTGRMFLILALGLLLVALVALPVALFLRLRR
jgi:hypothetical protein